MWILHNEIAFDFVKWRRQHPDPDNGATRFSQQGGRIVPNNMGILSLRGPGSQVKLQHTFDVTSPTINRIETSTGNLWSGEYY